MDNIIESTVPAQELELRDPTKERLVAVNDCIQSSTSLVDSVGTSLQSAEGCLNALNNCMVSVDQLANSICSSVTDWKQIDKEMHAMNLHFEQFSKELDVDLDKYRIKVPVIEKQLDDINGKLSKVLETVLTKPDLEMDFRMKLMDMVDSFLNNISQTMIKML